LQARNQHLTPLEPIEELGEGVVEETASKLLEPLMGCHEPAKDWMLSLYGEISSQELQATLLALAK